MTMMRMRMMIMIAALTWASLGLNRPLEIFLEVEQIGKLEGDHHDDDNDDDDNDEDDKDDDNDNHYDYKSCP